MLIERQLPYKIKLVQNIKNQLLPANLSYGCLDHDALVFGYFNKIRLNS